MTSGRVILEDPPTQLCPACGSVRIGLVVYDGSMPVLTRKECLSCGAIGPFVEIPEIGPHGY